MYKVPGWLYALGWWAAMQMYKVGGANIKRHAGRDPASVDIGCDTKERLSFPHKYYLSGENLW